MWPRPSPLAHLPYVLILMHIIEWRCLESYHPYLDFIFSSPLLWNLAVGSKPFHLPPSTVEYVCPVVYIPHESYLFYYWSMLVLSPGGSYLSRDVSRVFVQTVQRQTDSPFLLSHIYRHAASVLGVSRELAGQRAEVQINRERRTVNHR